MHTSSVVENGKGRAWSVKSATGDQDAFELTDGSTNYVTIEGLTKVGISLKLVNTKNCLGFRPWQLSIPCSRSFIAGDGRAASDGALRA